MRELPSPRLMHVPRLDGARVAGGAFHLFSERRMLKGAIPRFTMPILSPPTFAAIRFAPVTRNRRRSRADYRRLTGRLLHVVQKRFAIIKRCILRHEREERKAAGGLCRRLDGMMISRHERHFLNKNADILPGASDDFGALDIHASKAGFSSLQRDGPRARVGLLFDIFLGLYARRR